MTQARHNPQSGLSLIEILVAVTLLSVVGAAANQLIGNMVRTQRALSLTRTRDELRKDVEEVFRDSRRLEPLRDSRVNPEYVACLSGGSCTFNSSLPLTVLTPGRRVLGGSAQKPARYRADGMVCAASEEGTDACPLEVVASFRAVCTAPSGCTTPESLVYECEVRADPRVKTMRYGIPQLKPALCYREGFGTDGGSAVSERVATLDGAKLRSIPGSPAVLTSERTRSGSVPEGAIGEVPAGKIFVASQCGRAFGQSVGAEWVAGSLSGTSLLIKRAGGRIAEPRTSCLGVLVDAGATPPAQDPRLIAANEYFDSNPNWPSDRVGRGRPQKVVPPGQTFVVSSCGGYSGLTSAKPFPSSMVIQEGARVDGLPECVGVLVANSDLY